MCARVTSWLFCERLLLHPTASYFHCRAQQLWHNSVLAGSDCFERGMAHDAVSCGVENLSGAHVRHHDSLSCAMPRSKHQLQCHVQAAHAVQHQNILRYIEPNPCAHALPVIFSCWDLMCNMRRLTAPFAVPRARDGISCFHMPYSA
jgi:hypothetical protein